MKYDQYDIFESPDLRLFSNKYKSGGFTDLFKSGMELISPLELISLQLNFENKEDLDKLKNIYETRTILLNKQSCIYNRTRRKEDSTYMKKPELIIVSSNKIKTKDLVYSDGSCRIFYPEDYNLWEKEALKLPEKVCEEFLTKHNDTKNGIQDRKWKQEVLEFILNGNQKLIQDYIKYNEEITNKPFFEDFEISRGSSGIDSIEPSFNVNTWNLLRIWSGEVLEHSFDEKGKNKVHYPFFEFDDESNGIFFFGTRLIGISTEFSDKISRTN